MKLYCDGLRFVTRQDEDEFGFQVEYKSEFGDGWCVGDGWTFSRSELLRLMDEMREHLKWGWE